MESSIVINTFEIKFDGSFDKDIDARKSEYTIKENAIEGRTSEKCYISKEKKFDRFFFKDEGVPKKVNAYDAWKIFSTKEDMDVLKKRLFEFVIREKNNEKIELSNSLKEKDSQIQKIKTMLESI